MNHALQPDLHPDAESLNAFMEQALPAPERAEVLEHIAGCSRCRQIVYLAQEAVEEAEASVTIPPAPARAEPWYRKWSLHWQMAWVPAAAIAMVVAVAVVVHLRHLPGGGEVAKATLPAQIAEQPSIPEKPAPKALVQPSEPATEPKTAKKSPAPAMQASSLEQLSEKASPGTWASEAGAADSLRAEAPGAAGAAPEAPANVAAETPPEPAVAAWQEQRMQAEAAKSARSSQARLGTKMDEFETRREFAGKAATASRTVTKSASQEDFEPAPGRSPMYSAAVSTPRDLPAQPAAAKLPSGLAVVSSATVGRRTVALDAAGALYRKDSPTGKWEPVARQWTGRLVEVKAATAAGSTKAAEGERPEGAAAGRFEIANASGQGWVSQDGKTWVAR